MESSLKLWGMSDMDIAFLVFKILMVFVLIPLLLVAVRRILKKEPYEFILVFMRPGVNDHVKVGGSSLDFTHKHGKKEYEIKSDRLYRVKPRFPVRLWWRFLGVKERFLTVYRHKQTTPIEPEAIQVTARILKEVHDSRALGQAMRSEFKVPMDLKKILMIVGFLVIVAIVYVIVMGGDLAL